MSDVRKVTLWGRLRSFHWGEASLWLLFVVCGLGGLSNGSSPAVTFAGIVALAAIGVRATRATPAEAPDAQG
jgi:hypothetical protein